MYTIINNKKLSIMSVSADVNVLNLQVGNEYSMQDTFDLFKNSDISTISVLDDNDETTDIYIGYTNIDGFYYIPSSKTYTITLMKFELNSLKDDVDALSGLKDDVDKLNALKDDVDALREEFDNIGHNEFAKQQACALSMFAQTLSDEQAMLVMLLFDEWSTNVEYKLGDRIVFEDRFWKCLKDHKSNDTLKPTLANYLWVEIANPEDEYPEWKQPLGYADAYNIGDKVTFEGKRYISKIDGNTYSPATYPAGWELVE